jgi:cytochrome P450
MSSSYGLSTILAAALAAVCLITFSYNQITLYLARRKFAAENGCKAMEKFYPLKDPVFGIDNMMDTIKAAKETRLLERAQLNYLKHGNTFQSKLFRQKVLLTIEPQNVKTILSLRFKDFGIGNRETTLGPLLGQGIFTMDGSFWQHSRAMIRPNFARDQVADLEAFERHIQDLWKLIPRDGSTFDLQELFFRFTIDSATEFLFGQSTDTLKEKRQGGPDGAQFAKAFNEAQDACAMRFRLGLLRHLRKDVKGEEAMRICHEFVGQFVDEAIRFRENLDLEKQQADEKYVFLHELAKDTKDPRRLRDELLNVLLAGRDTTASLLSNMWFMLAKHPEIFEKLRREVEETLNGDLPTYEQLRSMKYLKYCMNECKSLPISFLENGLTCNASATTPPSRPFKLKNGNGRFRAPSRWWSRRSIPSVCAKGHFGRLYAVRHAPPKRLLWRRRGGLQARAVGRFAARLGIPTFQWWAKNLLRPTVCTYGGWVCYRQVVSGIQAAAQSRFWPVEGESHFDALFEERG